MPQCHAKQHRLEEVWDGVVTGQAVSFVELKRLPHHVAIIMDGNGRWARERGQSRSVGHREGAKAVREVVTTARRLGVKALTLYAFSEQNWARPEDEVEALMGLLADYISGERSTMLENSIRFRAIGRLERMPLNIRKLVADVSAVTASNTGMTLTLCLSYGGREEVTDVAREIARKVERGEVRTENVNEELIGHLLPSLSDGPVDLLIRTGGEYRISNFLLWAAAYAELYFTPKAWPEFGTADFFAAITAFQQRNRRFGLAENVEGPTVAGSQEVAAKAIAR
jgi:undecaprenyl diphosphate synthase